MLKQFPPHSQGQSTLLYVKETDETLIACLRLNFRH